MNGSSAGVSAAFFSCVEAAAEPKEKPEKAGAAVFLTGAEFSGSCGFETLPNEKGDFGVSAEDDVTGGAAKLKAGLGAGIG